MAIPFSPFHRKWCTERTNEFMTSDFAIWFRDPPEKTVTNFQEYVSIVKAPICLSEILERLSKNTYRWVHEWDNDMKRVFENAMVFNEPGSEPYETAQFFAKTYDKVCKYIPNNAEEKELIALYQDCDKLLSILDCPPPHVKNLQWEVPTFKESQMPNEKVEIKLTEKSISPSVCDALKAVLSN